MPLAIDFDEVHVWYLETQGIGEEIVGQTDAILSYEERVCRDRFRYFRDRRDYAIAHDLLRKSLSRYRPFLPTTWQFMTDVRGKPYLKTPDQDLSHPVTPPLMFNLSHCHGLVACAVALVAVGVDVERVDRIQHLDEFAERYLSHAEVAPLRTETNTRQQACRLIELWTLKEAFIKATGDGLSERLGSFAFEFECPSTINFKPPAAVPSTAWHFGLFEPTPDTRLAVALRVASSKMPRLIVRAANDPSLQALTPLRVTMLPSPREP